MNKLNIKAANEIKESELNENKNNFVEQLSQCKNEGMIALEYIYKKDICYYYYFITLN